MKKFEYRNFHFKPVIQLTAEQFGKFIFEKLNEIGAEGWQAIEVKTPSVQPNMLTGDVLVLASREFPAEIADFTSLEIALVQAFRPIIQRFLKSQSDEQQTTL